jgi:altronate dehydratase small subunit
MQQSAIMIDTKDNVATALRQMEREEFIRIETEGRVVEVTLSQAIPAGHKFVLTDIDVGEPIIKYGEVIGLAAQRIRKGEHAHIHNIEGQKGRGDKS